MRSEFLITSPPVLHEAHRKLAQSGYAAGSGKTYRGPIISVDHEPADLRRVDAIVHEVDPAAQRY